MRLRHLFLLQPDAHFEFAGTRMAGAFISRINCRRPQGCACACVVMPCAHMCAPWSRRCECHPFECTTHMHDDLRCGTRLHHHATMCPQESAGGVPPHKAAAINAARALTAQARLGASPPKSMSLPRSNSGRTASGRPASGTHYGALHSL